MNILSSALPGIREVRAPLIAGYLWLLLLWLICDPGKNFTNVHGTAAEIVDLCRTAGPIATAVGVSVAAYLIGALSHPLASVLSTLARGGLGGFGAWLTERLAATVPAPARPARAPAGSRNEAWERELVNEIIHDTLWIASPPEATRHNPILAGPVTFAARTRIEYETERSHGTRTSQLYTQLEDAERTLTQLDRSLVRETWGMCTVSTEPIDDDIVRAERLYDSMPGNRRDNAWAVLVETTRDLADDAERQLTIPATLLVGDQPLPFAQADRERAEAELRIDVALPLAALSVYLTATESAAWVAGLGAVVALLWQGLLREDASKQLIIETLHHKRIPITAFEKFSRAVDEAEAQAAE